MKLKEPVVMLGGDAAGTSAAAKIRRIEPGRNIMAQRRQLIHINIIPTARTAGMTVTGIIFSIDAYMFT